MQRLTAEERRQTDERWFRQQPVPGAAFRLNDTVSILRGDHTGQGGAIISLEALEPEPHYLVELGTGSGDVIVQESYLQFAQRENDLQS